MSGSNPACPGPCGRHATRPLRPWGQLGIRLAMPPERTGFRGLIERDRRYVNFNVWRDQASGALHNHFARCPARDGLPYSECLIHESRYWLPRGWTFIGTGWAHDQFGRIMLIITPFQGPCLAHVHKSENVTFQ